MDTGYIKKIKRGYHPATRRPDRIHGIVTNQTIIKSLAKGALVRRVAKDLDVSITRVRRLAEILKVKTALQPSSPGQRVAPNHGMGGAGVKAGYGHGTRGQSGRPTQSSVESTRGAVGGTAPDLARLTAPALAPSTPVSPEGIEFQIRAQLIQHLGSENAADVWLNSTKTGYPTTAVDAIKAGKGGLVLEDLENQWGPGPSYA